MLERNDLLAARLAVHIGARCRFGGAGLAAKPAVHSCRIAVCRNWWASRPVNGWRKGKGCQRQLLWLEKK